MLFIVIKLFALVVFGFLLFLAIAVMRFVTKRLSPFWQLVVFILICIGLGALLYPVLFILMFGYNS
ncbi:MAG: hypothetical protein PUG13_05550 [Streptococcus hyointestinalis]|nr:hypothetical protein [Streptococcus hyointestinalis]MDD6384862.1 hypothetical protein [Streptococcus hyointestinalis]